MKVRPSTYGLAYEEGTPSSDAFAVEAWDETVAAVLCDGAGSGEAAREAAHRAVHSLIENYRLRPRSWSPQRTLQECTHLLNRTLYQESMARFDRPEMITTLAAAIIEGDRLYGLNVGDSKVCLARGGELQVLSKDHVDDRQSHVLTRALGMSDALETHVFDLDLQDGDVALLCSDGVANQLSAEVMAAALAERHSARGIVKSARDLATPESMDDMSAIVLDISETGKLRAMSERPLPILPKLRKGDVVDGFELLRPFAGTDRVWLAEKEGARVVVKFAPLEAIESEAHLNAFARETWNAIRLTDDCFVRAYEPGGQTARYYVMEFVDAPSLQHVLSVRLLSIDSAVALGRMLAGAGQALLRKDLIHGDIKPENILCVGDYASLTYKLVDLGSSAEVFSVTSRAGTASYLAPERFSGGPVSECTEIFAMGATLYQALTGVLPYGQIERFQTPSFRPARRPLALNPNIPPWLNSIILRAIAIQPTRRYQHYSELAYDLEHPEQVQPFFDEYAPLLLRSPLAFYKTGFFLLLALVLWLLMKLLTVR